MQSQTHIILALAALSKKGDRKRNWAIAAGSIIPDIAIYLWAPYQYLVNGVSGEEMWRELYFEAPMQNLIAWFNSIPIYAALAVVGFSARSKLWGKLLLCFALAALIHLATDLPVHAKDAYRHFWPLSDWRFHSPLSYWDNNHHAGWVARFESLLALGCIAVLWQRFPRRLVKIALSVLALYYGLVLVAPIFIG